MALSEACQESIWLRRLLADLKCVQHEPTVIYEDNQSCISLAKNPVFHKRTKHIDIRHHFTRECIARKEITLVFCSSEEMVADILQILLFSKSSTCLIKAFVEGVLFLQVLS